MEDPLFQIIPGLRAAVEAETRQREVAFLPVNESICGVEVLPFTPIHFTALDAVRSPFVHGGIPSAGDVLAFLWCVSPEYQPGARFKAWRFARRNRGIDYFKALAGIQEYLSQAFGDAPGRKDTGFTPSYYSGTAAAVDLLAHQYGWHEKDILRMPYKRIFQYARCIKSRLVEKPIHFNRSEELIARWQEEQDRKARELDAN